MKIMKNAFFASILLNTLLSISMPSANASQGRGGGSFTEADLKHFLGRLITYIESEEGKKTFPEIVSYDLAHPNATIKKIATELNPHLATEAVYDSNGNERDCVSGIEAGVRFFTCNSKRLPQFPDASLSNNQKSVYYGGMYRLALHEVLVQVGLEDQLRNEIPSNYPISSRLSVHLELFPEWMPGSGILNHAKSDDINKLIASTFPLDGKYPATCVDQRIEPNPNLPVERYFDCEATITVSASTVDIKHGDAVTHVPTLNLYSGVFGHGSAANGSFYFTAGTLANAKIYDFHDMNFDFNYSDGNPIPDPRAQSLNTFSSSSIGYGTHNVHQLEVAMSDLGTGVSTENGLPRNKLILTRGYDGYVYFTIQMNALSTYAFGKIKVSN